MHKSHLEIKKIKKFALYLIFLTLYFENIALLSAKSELRNIFMYIINYIIAQNVHPGQVGWNLHMETFPPSLRWDITQPGWLVSHMNYTNWILYAGQYGRIYWGGG